MERIQILLEAADRRQVTVISQMTVTLLDVTALCTYGAT